MWRIIHNTHDVQHPLLIQGIFTTFWDRFKKTGFSQSDKNVLTKTNKQIESRLPRRMIPEEVLVLFVLDSNAPPIDDDVFNDAFQYFASIQTEKVLFGSWKVIRVPELMMVPPGSDSEKLQLPGLVVDEIRSWDAAQFQQDALRIIQIRTLSDINAFAIVIRLEEKKESKSKPVSVQFEGKEYYEGQSMSLQEYEDFFHAMVKENPGPVTIQSIDETTGTKVTSRVQKWSDFTNGPRTNKEVYYNQINDYKKKGYLAFYETAPGKLECRTPFRALIPQYFQDFQEFKRCQDIPEKYFQPVSSAPTCFVSHRWASLTHPDPYKVHFQVIRNFLQRNPTKLIWIDFSCLPQEPFSEADRLLFRDSIRDLNSLITMTQFIAIISEDYSSRAWCFYEWAVSRLFSGGKRVQIRPKNVEADFDPIVIKMVIDGKYPQLNVTKNDDMADINDLLVAGVGLFKTMALSVTLRVLNSFGFSFGVGIAPRFAQTIDFAEMWMIWQVLAGSSEHSGIKLPHLLDEQRLKNILIDRHERFGTHARIYQELETLSEIPLDLRIVEQASGDHLLKLIAKARQLGPVPTAYSTLAIVKLVYSLAEDREPGISYGA